MLGGSALFTCRAVDSPQGASFRIFRRIVRQTVTGSCEMQLAIRPIRLTSGLIDFRSSDLDPTLGDTRVDRYVSDVS